MPVTGGRVGGFRRKDLRRYKRMKDLLEADEELRDARDPKVKKLIET